MYTHYFCACGGSVYICVYMLEEHVGLYEHMHIYLYTCLHICVWFHVCTHWRYMSTSIYSHIYSHILIYTHLHMFMCCHGSRLPCAPGLSDGDPYSGSPRVLWDRPLCCHIFSCCAQHLTRSKLSEDRFIFGLLCKETQFSLLRQSIEAGALVTGLMTSTV